MHSALPWAVHPEYVDERATEFEFEGDHLISLDVTIASGDKIIGKLSMCAGMKEGHSGHKQVDNEQELRDNAALLFLAVNQRKKLLNTIWELVHFPDDLVARNRAKLMIKGIWKS